jgi:hypothetical protein
VDHKPESDLQLTDMQKKSDLQDMQKTDKAKSDTAKFDKVKSDNQNVPEVRAAQK